MRLWANLRGRVLEGLELDGVYLTREQARALSELLRRAGGFIPVNPVEQALIVRFQARVADLDRAKGAS